MCISVSPHISVCLLMCPRQYVRLSVSMFASLFVDEFTYISNFSLSIPHSPYPSPPLQKKEKRNIRSVFLHNSNFFLSSPDASAEPQSVAACATAFGQNALLRRRRPTQSCRQFGTAFIICCCCADIGGRQSADGHAFTTSLSFWSDHCLLVWTSRYGGLKFGF